MAELDRFDSQLTAAVQGFADRARTEVDAVAVATHAARGRRPASVTWLGRTVTVPVVLLLILVLVALLTASLAVGGWWPFRASLVLASPTAATASTTPSIAPSPSPDALGRVHVTGTETVVLTTEPTSLPDIDATHIYGGVVTITTTASDARASGTGTFAFSVDVNGDVGREWGTYRLETAGGTGAWEGQCSGPTWDGGNAAIGGCWLVGSGAYAGFTYYRSYSWIPGQVWVEGVIYPGPPPEP
jgi:hypothetical protein